MTNRFPGSSFAEVECGASPRHPVSPASLRDIITIGASAGGVEALKAFFSHLPGDLAAAVFVVLHISPTFHSALPEILRNAGRLRVTHAEDSELIEFGRVYVAPPDHHLVLDTTHMMIHRGPKENRHRPAIDPLFRSAARTYGSRVIGILLSGTLDDGTAGLIAIKEHGGVAIVQDPAEAKHPEMPRNALRFDDPDYCLRIPQIALLLSRLVAKAGVRERA